MTKRNGFLLIASAAFLLAAVSCKNLDTIEAPSAGASVSSSGAVHTPLSKLRAGADLEAAMLKPESEWNNGITEDVYPVFAFELEGKQMVARLDITLSYEDGDVHRMIFDASDRSKVGSIGTVKGRIWWWKMSDPLASGAWTVRVQAKFEDGTYTPPLQMNLNVAAGAEKPADPTPAVEPEISNFRWNTTGNVKTSDKAEWNPTTFQKGSRLWFGLDSTEVAESVTFILNKNGQEERKNLTPANHVGYVGLGTNNGFIWAMYPTVLDFTGNAKIKVEVHYAGNITKTTREGSFTVVEPAPAKPVEPAKPVAPAVTNIRWGNSIDSVRAANKANWNKPLKKGDRLIIGVDTDVNEVVSAKFQLYRRDLEGKNPRAYYIYANHDTYKDWGKLDGNSLWFEYTDNPTNYVGEAWTSVEIKYKNGTSRWVEPKVPVEAHSSRLSNIRWATEPDGVKEVNKANWNKDLNMGDALFVGIDAPADDVDGAKFTISRNGKPELFYMHIGRRDSVYMGYTSANSIWLRYPNDPTNFTGKLDVWIDITFKDGTTEGIGASATVKNSSGSVAPPPPAQITRKLTVRKTLLEASFRMSYGGYNYWMVLMQIVDASQRNNDEADFYLVKQKSGQKPEKVYYGKYVSAQESGGFTHIIIDGSGLNRPTTILSPSSIGTYTVQGELIDTTNFWQNFNKAGATMEASVYNVQTASTATIDTKKNGDLEFNFKSTTELSRLLGGVVFLPYEKVNSRTTGASIADANYYARWQ